MTTAPWSASAAPPLDWWRTETPAPPASAEFDQDAPARSSSGQGGFYALVVFTVVLIAAPQEFFEALKPLRLALIAALIAMATYVVNVMAGRARPPVAAREIRIVLLLVVWAVATVPLSYWPGGSVDVLTELYLKSVAIFILLAGAVDSRQRLIAIVWTLGLCTIPIALTALQNYRTGVYLPTAPGRIAGYGTSGLAGNPNDLALLLNLILPFLIALAGPGQASWKRLAAMGTAFLAAAAIVVTFSRSGFLTLVTIGLLYLWQAARRGHVGLAAFVFTVALGVFFLAPAGYGARLSTVSDIETDPTGSAQDRWRDMVVATGYVVEHPVVGAGVGMDFLALNERRGNRWLSVHNAYLNYAVDLGLPGLLLFVALYASCLRRISAVERARRTAGREDIVTRLAGATRISLVAFGVAAFFYPVAYNAFFYYVAGLGLALAQTVAGRPAGAADPGAAA